MVFIGLSAFFAKRSNISTKQKMKKTVHTWAITLKISALLIFLTTAAQSQTIRYVTATGTGNGSSWATASGDIQAMINASDPGDQIWVATGTYKPNRKTDALETVSPNDRNNSFVLKNGIKLYGSFAGTETALAERVLPTGGNYTSVLSGDFNNDDVVTGSGATLAFTGTAENAYHVIVASGTQANPITSATILNGFTITGGNANALDNAPAYPVTGGTAIEHRAAGGIHSLYSSVAYSNINITKNAARRYGGVYLGPGSTGSFANAYITYNGNGNAAGGMYVAQGVSGTYTNVLISGNRGSGGQLWGGTHVFTNCTVANNDSGLGAAFYNLAATVTYRNTVISGNTSVAGINGNGSIMYNFNSTVVYQNSLVEGTSGTTNVLNGNLINTTDPMYMNAAAGDYSLDPDSPLINAGSNTYFAAGETPDLSAITTDAAGNLRIQDVTVDIGALEYTPCNVPLPVAVAQSACSTATVASLQVTLDTGATAVWYADATTLTPLAATTVVTAGLYYVAQKIGTCESNRVPVVITIMAPQPQGDSAQTYNDGDMLSNLYVTVTPPAALSWYADANLATPLPATTVLQHDVTYYAVATEGACTSLPLAVTVSDLASVNDAIANAKITYYPNPVTDRLTIEAADAINTVTVYTMLGQVLVAETWNSTTGNLDMQQLNAGTYIVEAASAHGKKVFRIVKR